MTTNCPTEDVLLDYISGSLEPAKAALFERHADGCGRCAALRMSQAAVWQSLDNWKPAPVSEGFNRELWRRIDAEPQASSWTFSFWKQLAPLAVATALMVTAFVWDHSTRQSATAPEVSAPTVVVTLSDAERLERALDDIQLLQAADAAATPAKAPANLM